VGVPWRAAGRGLQMGVGWSEAAIFGGNFGRHIFGAVRVEANSSV